jgi:hypothetical protein
MTVRFFSASNAGLEQQQKQNCAQKFLRLSIPENRIIKNHLILSAQSG